MPFRSRNVSVEQKSCQQTAHSAVAIVERVDAQEIMYKNRNHNKRFDFQDIRELCPSLSISSIEGALRKLVASGELAGSLVSTKAKRSSKSLYAARIVPSRYLMNGTTSSVPSCHSYMNNPMAGRTKSVQNYISATYPNGHVETLFTPLAPYETPEALDRICAEYNRIIGN